MNSLHLIDLDEFTHVLNIEDVQDVYLLNLYKLVKQLKEISQKHIVQKTLPRALTGISDIANQTDVEKPTEKVLGLILQEKIKPKCYKDIRFLALEEIKKKKSNRFNVKQTSPKEFKFRLDDRREKRYRYISPSPISYKSEAAHMLSNFTTSPIESHKNTEGLLYDQFDLYEPERLPNII